MEISTGDRKTRERSQKLFSCRRMWALYAENDDYVTRSYLLGGAVNQRRRPQISCLPHAHLGVLFRPRRICVCPCKLLDVPERKSVPAKSHENIPFLDFLPSNFLDDLIGYDNFVPDVVVNLLTQFVFCLQSRFTRKMHTGHRYQSGCGLEMMITILTSCSGKSISEPLISSLSWRIAFPIVTDMGREFTR
jgi:hypothetical protein